ncbi:MAG: methylenetetrahydrofolate reductase [Cyanobacteria bacterium J06639_1]
MSLECQPSVPAISTLQAAAQRGDFLITSEVAPPKGGDPAHMLEIVDKLRGRVHAINVTDSNRAVARMSPLAAAVLIQRAGIEPVMQLACRDRNRIALQGDLMGASALGIRNVLALTGDPVKHGDCPKARQVSDLESVRLLHLIKNLNRGLDCNDKPLPNGSTAFFPGAAADPQHPNPSSQKRRCERKVSRGAEFFQTQLITDFQRLDQFMETVARPLHKPVLAGVFLLKSAKNARFINKYLPGVQIPDTTIARLERAEIPLQEGIVIAAEQVRQVRHICQGVHLMAVKAEHLIVDILDRAEIPPIV